MTIPPYKLSEVDMLQHKSKSIVDERIMSQNASSYQDLSQLLILKNGIFQCNLNKS